mgnify:CR=1 FL=1
MNSYKRLDLIYKNALRYDITNDSRLVLFSDVHRGVGNAGDDFSQNQNLFFHAISEYYRKGYTYVELGDGDELWENRSMRDIVAEHSHVFWMLKRFFDENRLIMLYGNHDIVKRSPRWLAKNYYHCYNERLGREEKLFDGIKVYEGLLLACNGAEALLLHGHQVDTLNSTLWRLARFLVRYLWRPLELVGIKDPSSARNNNKLRGTVEERLHDWAADKGRVVVAGHTHRPVFSRDQKTYFNDGSAVHPRCITAIELNGGAAALVKWSVMTRADGVMYIGREVLDDGCWDCIFA